MMLPPMNPRYRHNPDTGIGNHVATVVCDSVLH